MLVADYYNHRVVSLSTSLTRLGYMTVPGHELQESRSLRVDLLNHLLYIAEGTRAGRLFVLVVDDSVQISKVSSQRGVGDSLQISTVSDERGVDDSVNSQLSTVSCNCNL